MAEEQTRPAGPDLVRGVALSDFAGETLLGHVGDQDVLLVRSDAEIFAIDAHCSHYHGPLAEGLVVGQSIRCPWHHACFDLRTGEAVRAPALGPLAVWQVEQEGDRLFVRKKREQPEPRGRGPVETPGRTCGVNMSRHSAASRPARRMPSKPSGPWILIVAVRLAGATTSRASISVIIVS